MCLNERQSSQVISYFLMSTYSQNIEITKFNCSKPDSYKQLRFKVFRDTSDWIETTIQQNVLVLNTG